MQQEEYEDLHKDLIVCSLKFHFTKYLSFLLLLNCSVCLRRRRWPHPNRFVAADVVEVPSFIAV